MRTDLTVDGLGNIKDDQILYQGQKGGQTCKGVHLYRRKLVGIKKSHYLQTHIVHR